jgi:hypothetical protein
MNQIIDSIIHNNKIKIQYEQFCTPKSDKQ